MSLSIDKNSLTVLWMEIGMLAKYQVMGPHNESFIAHIICSTRLTGSVTTLNREDANSALKVWLARKVCDHSSLSLGDAPRRVSTPPYGGHYGATAGMPSRRQGSISLPPPPPEEQVDCTIQLFSGDTLGVTRGADRLKRRLQLGLRTQTRLPTARADNPWSLNIQFPGLLVDVRRILFEPSK